MIINCNDIQDTEKLAKAFSGIINEEGAFITLKGEIGVGKTAFTRFLLKELGVSETVTSPTFVILNEYHGENHIPIYHFDLYRLEHTGIKTIKPELEEYSTGKNLTLVEWANFADSDLPKERLDIKISYKPNQINSRIFEINAFGNRAIEIYNKLKSEYEVVNASSCI